MKKALLAAIFAALMIPASAAAEDINIDTEPEASVEISFRLGESVIMINGEELETEAPYTTESGTTLVPLRVISEAFGAEVGWDEAAQTVSVSYPEVELTLTVGSKAAVINTHTEELEAAPELYNGVTMVPLRFICESFGAEVSYDDETLEITVVKTADGPGEVTLEGSTDKDYIGDSRYGWTMATPKTMHMSTSEMFGNTSYTSFYGEEGHISIEITKHKKPVTPEEAFNDMLKYSEMDTISAADIRETDGVTYVRIAGRSSYSTEDMRAYIYDKYTYAVTATAYKEDDENPDMTELYRIIDTFSITDKGRDYYDISGVKDGKQEFENKEYKVKVTLPGSWDGADADSGNMMTYTDTASEDTELMVNIYSDDKMSAAEMARHDRDIRAGVSNPEQVTVSEVVPYEINGLAAEAYTVTYKKQVFKNVIAGLGRYVYDITAFAASEAEADAILAGVSFEELDYATVGSILRREDLGYDWETDFAGGKLKVSRYWQGSMFGGIILSDVRTGSALINEKMQGVKNGDIEAAVYDVIEMQLNDPEPVGEAKREKRGGRDTYIRTFKSVEEDENGEEVTAYATVYVIENGGKYQLIAYIRDDTVYSGGLDKEVDDMINSIKYEK